MPKSADTDVINHIGALKRYARSLIRNDAEAEDLVHDALVRAYEGGSSFRSGGNLRAWLLSIVHNAFVDRLRSDRAEAARIAAAGHLADTATEAAQEHSVRLAQVREAFFELPDEQRMVLHLVAIEGLSYRQTSHILGVPIGTVISRLSRARATLRALEDTSSPRRHLRIVGGRNEPGG